MTTPLDGHCVMCGAEPGQPCTVIGGSGRFGDRPGDVRSTPHFNRTGNDSHPPGVAVKDEPDYYLDTPENKARFESEYERLPSGRWVPRKEVTV